MLPQIIAIPARPAPDLHEAVPLKPEFRVNSFEKVRRDHGTGQESYPGWCRKAHGGSFPPLPGFLKTYSRHLRDRHLRDTLMDRVRLRDPFVYLRGISWSAMGWVAYQTRFSGMKNPDTWAKLQQYMNLKFIRSLFDPFIKNK